MDCGPHHPCGSAGDGRGSLSSLLVRLDRYFGHHTDARRGDVRHGTDTSSVRLPAGLAAPERHPHRRTGTVSHHALAGVAALQVIVAAGRTRLGSNPRRMLSGRYGQQCHLLPGQRRCSPERGHDRSFYTAGSHRNACPRMAACRRISGSRCGRHVFKYRTGGDSAHRTGSGCQSLLPAHHPTDCTVATDDFHLIYCVHHRHYRSTQRSQHPCMQPDSGRSGNSAQRTRTGLGLWSLLSCRK